MNGPISIQESYAGRHVLLAGGTGFLGKVWLGMMLERVPDIAKIYVLVRGRGRSVHERFEKIMRASPAFRRLHERHGEKLADFLVGRLELVEGDVGQPDMGIHPDVAARLRRDLDLVVNFAGLVDFSPDLRDSMVSNVDGAVNVARFVEESDHAALVHVSTAFVAGDRNGFIEEKLFFDQSPDGNDFVPSDEYAAAQESIERIEADHHGETITEQIRDEVMNRIRDRGYEASESRVSSMVHRMRRTRIRQAMIAEGSRRARALGWQNTYTYTKALAERLVSSRGNGLRYAIFRPAVVESAVEFPFPGWNEGFNTSGPLVYLAGTWFRHIPGKPDNPFDVIPVDLVANGLTIVGAAVLRNEHVPVYHCGTSDGNTLTLERTCELAALYHRRYLRKHGESRSDRLLLSRWDAVVRDPEHGLNPRNIRRVVHQVTRFLRKGLPEKIPFEVRDKADDLAKSSEYTERKLRQIEEVLDLFLPFTHDNDQVFECRAISRHGCVEPEFYFTPHDIDWRPYWLDVQMPGLRKWCFPAYEGKEREGYTPDHPFDLPDIVAKPDPVTEAEATATGQSTATPAPAQASAREEVG